MGSDANDRIFEWAKATDTLPTYGRKQLEACCIQ